MSAGTGGEISIGTATNVAGLIAATEVAGFGALNRLWVDNSPTTTVEAVTTVPQFVVTEDITLTTATEAVGSGGMDIFCIWYPLSKDSSLQSV